MGLDITAHQRATLLTDHEPPTDNWCPSEDLDARDRERHMQAYVDHPAFLPSAAGLEMYDQPAGSNSTSRGRCYRLAGQRITFRAGSYSGYGRWRAALTDAAKQLPTDDDRPFYLLTYFSDCEGWIGPRACRLLSNQFVLYGAEMKRLLTEQDVYDAQLYDQWADAFALAADTGVVRFH